MLRPWLPVLVLLTGCPTEGFGPPPADSCDVPVQSELASLEVGPGTFANTPFVAWQAEDTVVMTRGGQGGDMLGVRFRITGAKLPACLQQTTVITAPGTTPRTYALSLRTYAQADGSRQTRTWWLAEGFPEQFSLQSTAGGRMVTTHLSLPSSRRTPDAGSSDL